MINLIKEIVADEDSARFKFNDHCFSSIIKIKDTFLENDNGDIVECGVWRGIMITFLAKVFPKHKIWACDSFNGFPENEDQIEFHKFKEYDLTENRGLHIADESFLLNNLKKYKVENSKRIKILKGWFKDTLQYKKCPIKKISILRIDADTYSSTLEVLTHLYPKVVKGGIVILDDWVLGHPRQATIDFFGGLYNIPTLYDPITYKPVDLENFDNNIHLGIQGTFFRK